MYYLCTKNVQQLWEKVEIQQDTVFVNFFANINLTLAQYQENNNDLTQSFAKYLSHFIVVVGMSFPHHRLCQVPKDMSQLNKPTCRLQHTIAIISVWNII